MATSTATIPRIDSRFNKFSQAGVVLLAAVAYLTNQPVIVLIAAVALGLSALFPAFGPFRLLYRFLVVPLHLLTPRLVEDDPAPHRFAQGVGATFLIAATLIFYLTAYTALGWTLDLIVFVLAALNFTVGFCAGCFVYYHLGRLGITPRVRYAGAFHWRGV